MYYDETQIGSHMTHSLAAELFAYHVLYQPSNQLIHVERRIPCVQCNNKFPVLLKGIIAINFFRDGSPRVNGLCEYKALMDGQCMYNFSV